MLLSLPSPRRGRLALAALLAVLSIAALTLLPSAALASGEGVFAEPVTTSTSTPSPTGATITSDKQDYPPGAAVTLSGAGWVPGETVEIVVEDDGVSANFWRHEVAVTADANGHVTDQFNLADWFVADYYVSATGDQSGQATHSFTDSPKKISGSGHEGQSKVAGVLGGYSNGQVTEYEEGESINFRFTLDATHGPASGKLEVRFSRDDGFCSFFEPAFALGAIEALSGPQPTVTVDSGPTASGDGSEWIVVLNVNYATTFDHTANSARVNYTLTLSDQAGECNGSSQFSRLNEPSVGAGDVDQSGVQNVPVPANQLIELPEITATKLIDRDGDGTFEDTADAGEYRFTLDGTTQLLTDANGQVVFPNVTPDGPHTVTEQQVVFTQGTYNFDSGVNVSNCAFVGSTAGPIVSSGTTSTDASCTFRNEDRPVIDVQASSHTVTFGDAAPSITCTYDTNDFVDGDDEADLTTSPDTGSTTYDQGDEVGDGELLAPNAGKYGTSCASPGATDEKYDFNYVPGTVTVQKVTVDVQANSPTVTFGDAVPAITCAYDDDDFVGTDDEGDLDASPNTGGSTTYDQGDEVGDGELLAPNAGKYGTSCATAGASDDNYSFNFIDGALTVQKKTVDVQANSPTVTFGDAAPTITCTYDDNDFVGTDDEDDLDASPNTGGSTTYDQGDEVGDGELLAPNAGKYNTSCATAGAADDNYSFNFIDGALTVQKKTVDVQANSPTVTFGDAVPAITCAYDDDDFVGTDDEDDLDASPNTGGSTTYDQGDEVGDGELLAPNAGKYGTSCATAGASDDNYDFNYLPGALAVQKATVDVQANSPTVTFGDAAPSITCVYDDNDFVGTDDEGDLDASPNTGGSTTYDQGDEVGDGELLAPNAGKYGTSCATAGAADDNYDFNYLPGALTVQKKTVDVQANSPTVTFGDAAPSITCVYDDNDFVGTDDEGDLDASPNTGGSTTYDQGDEVGDGELLAPNAGKYNTSCATAGAADDNYDFNFIDGALTVQKATVDVQANSPTVTFGDAVPAITCVYDDNDFVGTDDEGDLDASPNTGGSTTYDQGDEVGDGELLAPNAGKYGTSCATAGAADDNYDFNYLPGALTVGKKQLTVTASSHGVAYGDPVPLGLDCDFTGFVGTDGENDLDVKPLPSTTYTQGDGAGNYPTRCDQLPTAPPSSDDNYSFNFVNGQITVRAQTLTVTATSHSVDYGDAVPAALDCDYTGFVGTDDENDLDVKPLPSTTYTQGDGAGDGELTGANAGKYVTRCDQLPAAPPSSDDNYAFNFVNGAITVGKKQLTVTASSHPSLVYGDPVPAGLDCDFTGFVLGDDENDLDVKPLPSTTYNQGAGVGGSPYPTRCDQLPAAPPSSDDNYSFNFVNGAITVAKKPLTVTASSHPNVVYGDAVPAGLDCNYSGFEPGDDESDLDVAPLPSTTYTQGDGVGNYPTRCDQLPAAPPSSDDNYSFNFVNGEISVAKKQLTVTASTHFLTYGDAKPTVNCSFNPSQFVGSDDVNDINTAPVGTTAYDQGDGVSGSPYSTTCSAPGGSDDNYSFTYSDGQVNLFKAVVDVTASSHTVTYGDPPPTVTCEYDDTDFKLGETGAVIDTAPTPSTTYNQGDPVGNYQTTCSGGQDDNYDFNFLPGGVEGGGDGGPGAITVIPKPLNGTFDAANKVYDGNTSASASNRQLSGIVGNDDVSLTGGTATFPNKDVGSYSVPLVGASLAGTDKDNYTLTGVANDQADITPKALNGTFKAADKVYDGNTSATASDRALTGVLAGETVTLEGGTATFPSKNVGSYSVPLTGATLGGADKDNYTLTGVANDPADITPKTVNGTFKAADKVYDGNTSATASDRALTGVVAGETVTLTGGVATFPSKDVGSYSVPLTGATLGGADKDNYTLAGVANDPADITPKVLTGTFQSADKVYDGNASATASDRSLIGLIDAPGSDGSSVGALAKEDVTLTGGTATFGTKDVGMGKNVTLAGAALGGADKDNYTLGGVNAAQANITPAPVTGSFKSADKVYDANTAAAATDRALKGVLAGETVTLTGGTAAFSSKDVGSYDVALTGASLGGPDAGNYALTGIATVKAAITPAPLTGAFTAADKDYDGNTDATITGRSLTGVVGSEDVSLVDGTAAFDDPEPGVGKPVTGAGFGLAGSDKGNYELIKVENTTATIRQRQAPPAEPPPVIDTSGNCLRRNVLAFVRGKRIKRVVFFLDGEKIARVTKADSKRRFSTLIERRTLADGDHRLQAKVFFFKTKRTYLLSLKLKRCVDKKAPVEIMTAGLPAERCPTKTFLAFVKGGTISKVRYTLNGELLKTSRVADWKERYAVKIDPTSLGAGPNILEATITFIRGSKTVTATLTRELPACGKATRRSARR